MTVYDPYDLWSSSIGVIIRRWYYDGKFVGKVFAVSLSIADLLAPMLLRRILRISPKPYPVLTAHECLRSLVLNLDVSPLNCLEELQSVAINPTNTEHLSWGLGLFWASKNGVYKPDVPFVTHTPYVMEALLAFADEVSSHTQAMTMFNGTWDFLESLKVMFEDDMRLALSYAPLEEPHIVVNANSYAAFAYALHAVHGREAMRGIAREKALRLTRWVVSQQNDDGSWFYTADRGPWDMIDGFHSCFVVKNLLKVKQLLPESTPHVDDAVARGWLFIREHIFDAREGLCRRYAIRPRRDAFKWELYDQAEYLGLLVDFSLLDEAQEFSRFVEQRFRKGEHWYCRIDVIGRLWGRDFLRWGITPFQYHQARLLRAQEARH